MQKGTLHSAPWCLKSITQVQTVPPSCIERWPNYLASWPQSALSIARTGSPSAENMRALPGELDQPTAKRRQQWHSPQKKKVEVFYAKRKSPSTRLSPCMSKHLEERVPCLRCSCDILASGQRLAAIVRGSCGPTARQWLASSSLSSSLGSSALGWSCSDKE